MLLLYTIPTFCATVKVHPHSDETIPRLRHDADLASDNRWIDFIAFDQVSVFVAIEYLREKEETSMVQWLCISTYIHN